MKKIAMTALATLAAAGLGSPSSGPRIGGTRTGERAGILGRPARLLRSRLFGTGRPGLTQGVRLSHDPAPAQTDLDALTAWLSSISVGVLCLSVLGR